MAEPLLSLPSAFPRLWIRIGAVLCEARVGQGWSQPSKGPSRRGCVRGALSQGQELPPRARLSHWLWAKGLFIQAGLRAWISPSCFGDVFVACFRATPTLPEGSSWLCCSPAPAHSVTRTPLPLPAKILRFWRLQHGQGQDEEQAAAKCRA